MSAVRDTFERKTFAASRLSEFATESELTKQVGHPASLWPLVVVKELVDNSLDAAENADLAPDIAVTVESHQIIVADQGPGISTAIVKALVDFTAKTSSNAAYCSPSRGQQGNALQSILAMPFALSGADGSVLIEAQGKAHDIKFTLDPVRQIPVVERTVTPTAVKNGTRTTVRWPVSPRSLLTTVDDALFTARRQLHLAQSPPEHQGGVDGRVLPQLEPFRPELGQMAAELRHFASLVHGRTARPIDGGEIARAEDKRLPCPSVRDFVRQFAGLTGTGKASEISTALSVGDRETLADYYRRHANPLSLLEEMRGKSRPIKPKALGVLGAEHLEGMLTASGCEASSVVPRKAEIEHDGLPYVLEAAFGYRGSDDLERAAFG